MKGRLRFWCRRDVQADPVRCHERDDRRRPGVATIGDDDQSPPLPTLWIDDTTVADEDWTVVDGPPDSAVPGPSTVFLSR